MKYFNETLLARSRDVAINQVCRLTNQYLQAGDNYTFYGFGATGRMTLKVNRHPGYDKATGENGYVNMSATHEDLFTEKTYKVYEKEHVGIADGSYLKELEYIWEKYSKPTLKEKT